MLALINGARRELVLTTPYFVPEDSLVTALRGAAARGVRVVVVLPRRIDSLLVRHASRSFFDEVLQQLPVGPLATELRLRVAAKLERRTS